MELFNSVLSEGMTAPSFFICLFGARLCGVIVAFAASVKSNASKSFVISLILLPMVVEVVIAMVNGNTGTGIAVMGAFSLVRFRSVPGKAKDIAALFLAMTAGIVCSAGYVVLAVIFTVFVSAILLLLSFVPLGDEKTLDLHITVPESLCFATEFDDLFKEYTKSHRLTRAKTSNMGSLYVLYYKIEMNDRNKMQEFIDKLRCRNGNLEISIAESAESVESI